MLQCSYCKKFFNIKQHQLKKFTENNLCCACRKRFGNVCQTCGKTITKEAVLCKSCSQSGIKNHKYKEGLTIKNKICSNCNNKTTSRKYLGLCQTCYLKTLTGEKNPNYRHGHYTKRFESNLIYKNWKLNIFKKNNFRCVLCNTNKSGQLQAHHILPKRDFPDFVFELWNGVTLCKECHELTYKKEYIFIAYFTNLALIMPYKNSVNSVNGEIPNTEPSHNFVEGVETRDVINFSKSAGERLLTT